jgi:hypothetical protein
LRRLALPAFPWCPARAVSRGPVERFDCSNDRCRESNNVIPCSGIVVLIGELQPVDHRAYGAAFGRAESAVLQIQVVDDRGDPRKRRSLDAEDGAQRLEGAALTLVAELDPEHVERDAVLRNRLAIGSEAESCLPIDEAPDQPGRRHAIDAGTRPRDPVSRLKRRHSS